MAVLTPFLRWPGLKAWKSFSYTLSRGATPGKIIIYMEPQDLPPAAYGNLTFGDGQNAIVLRDCAMVDYGPVTAVSGRLNRLILEDRRWRWRMTQFRGDFNIRDSKTNKIVPFTLTSPAEIATLIMRAMGEANYSITLPPGLRRIDSAKVLNLLYAGQNFPSTNTNPEISWNLQPATVCLQQLLEIFGAVLCYQPVGDLIYIGQENVGSFLSKSAPYIQGSDGIKVRPAPQSITCVGDSIKFQARFSLTHVMPEFGGHFVDADKVSYAPQNTPSKQVTVLTTNPAIPPGGTPVMFCDISGIPGQLPHRYLADGLSDLYNQLNADLSYIPYVRFSYDLLNNKLTMTSTENGFGFGVSAGVQIPTPPIPVNVIVTSTSVAKKASSWQNSLPGQCYDAQATDRYTKGQAVRLAANNLYRHYRIKFEDVGLDRLNRERKAANKGPIFQAPQIPGLPDGILFRRQQIVLLEDQVDLIVPSKAQKGVFVPIPGGGGNAPGPFGGQVNLPGMETQPDDFYTGRSLTKPARVFGSVARQIQTGYVFYNKQGFNTEPHYRVYVDFTIDPREQIVTFDQPVYSFQAAGGAGYYLPADLILECGCHILSPVDNQPLKFNYTRKVIGGIGPPEYINREGIKVGIVGRYKGTGNVPKVKPGENPSEYSSYETPIINFATAGDLAGELRPADQLYKTELSDLTNSQDQAEFYIARQALRYATGPSQVRKFIGIIKTMPDGIVSSVSWEIDCDAGPNAILTIASANTENDINLLPYPEVRRQEALAPDPEMVGRADGFKKLMDGFVRKLV